MKILVTEGQYFKLLIEQQSEIEFPEEIETPKEIDVKFTHYDPDTYHQKTFVYIEGMDRNDIELIIELKKNNDDVIVKLNNVLTKEVFEIPLEQILITKTTGRPYIDINEYNKFKDTLDTREVMLDVDFLKKKSSGFPSFMTKTLFGLYPNNIGKNSFITGDGLCNSEDGLIDIPDTNVPDQTWSILNYFDTNPMVIKKLIEWYMKGEFENNETPSEVTIKNFENWITDRSNHLFKNGRYLDELVKLNLTSYKSGSKTENMTIKKLTEPPFNINPNDIKQFCSGSKQDRIEGKDLEIKTSTGYKYAQVKPLSSLEYDEVTNTYTVRTYQMKNYKSKPLDYIIFTSAKGLSIFKNKNYTVPKKYMVVFKDAPLNSLD
jgi:hypothetical protein